MPLSADSTLTINGQESRSLGGHTFAGFPQVSTLRVTVALVVSLLLHIALVYGVVIKPQHVEAIGPVVLNATIHAPKKEENAVTITSAVSALELPAPSIPEDFSRKAPPLPRSVEPESVSPVEIPNAPQLPQVDIPLLVDPTYYTPKQLDVIPSITTPVKPNYPAAAVMDQVQGLVTLAVLIDEQGVVDNVSVVKSRPEGYFEESAVNAFREARFTPAQIHGRAVKSKVLLTVRFQLDSIQRDTN